jgi:hypothetical protein
MKITLSRAANKQLHTISANDLDAFIQVEAARVWLKSNYLTCTPDSVRKDAFRHSVGYAPGKFLDITFKIYKAHLKIIAICIRLLRPQAISAMESLRQLSVVLSQKVEGTLVAIARKDIAGKIINDNKHGRVQCGYVFDDYTIIFYFREEQFTEFNYIKVVSNRP